MSPLLQQRMVGTLVLIALGIVFWPLIFVTPETRDPIRLQPMADKPAVNQNPIIPPKSYEAEVKARLPEEPTNPSSLQEAADLNTETEVAVADLQSLPEAGNTGAELPRNGGPDSQSLIDDQGVAVFWVLQVATVGSEARAREIVEGLQARGYKAFFKRYVQVDDELYRVQVGPNAEQAKLLDMKTDIDAVLKVNSQVLRYTQ